MAHSGGFYLPPKDALTYEFMRDVLDGKKELIKVSALKTLTMPPKVEGLRIGVLWEQVKEDFNLRRYFPAFHGRIPPKDYFFNVIDMHLPQILNAVYPGFTLDLCEKIREQKVAQIPQEDKVNVSAEIGGFLSTAGNPGLFKAGDIGHFLKESRKWSHKRSSNPIQLNFKLPGMPEARSASKRHQRSGD